MKSLVENRKALFDYEILETLEVGIVLKGVEVKSITNGKCSLKESYVSIDGNELWWKQGYVCLDNISSFEKIEEKRERKLLASKHQIQKWKKEVVLSGLTLVPLNIYRNEKNKIKMTLALAKGKKLYDKREALKQKDLIIEAKREQKNYND